MKKFLVTNDDGIDAEGITELVKALARHGEVYVAAPAEQQSAKSMSLTFLRQVGVSRRDMEGASEAYAVDGAPADCVMWAVPWFRDRGIMFDHIFSGINLGANVGIAAYYSGTIGAAREGAIRGIRSLALSVGTHEAKHFDYVCGMLPKFIEMSDSMSPFTILSVNAPDLPVWQIRGLRIAEVAPRGYAEEYAFHREEASVKSATADADLADMSEGKPVMFQLSQISTDGRGSVGMFADTGLKPSADRRVLSDAELRYDLDCVRSGYAAVTPLSSGSSDDAALRRLQGRFAGEEMIAVFIDHQENIAAGIEKRNLMSGNAGRLAACVRRLGVPAVITRLHGCGAVIYEISSSLGDDDARKAASGRADRSGRRTEAVTRKEISAWASADFTRLMGSVSARKVLISGLETHGAVLQTALDFRRLGYEVMVAEDCCASADEHDHVIAVERMREAGCVITTCRAAVTEIMGTTAHPAAAAVQRILDRSF